MKKQIPVHDTNYLKSDQICNESINAYTTKYIYIYAMKIYFIINIMKLVRRQNHDKFLYELGQI
jgi:hypothetical protein